MKTINSYSLVQMGLAIRLLRQVDGSFSVATVLETAEQLKAAFDAAEFDISLRGFITLDDFLAEFKKLPDKTVSMNKLEEIEKIMYGLEQIAFAEATGKNAYLLGDDRYTLKALVSDPASMFAPGIYEQFSEIAQYDFTEAFQCLVFSRPTASAFHMLRATEDVIKQLYLSLIRTKRDKHPTWGSMTIAFKSRKRVPKEVKDLIPQLDNVRERFRNPTDHPLKIYTSHEASDLVSICTNLVNQIMPIIKK